MGLDMYAWTIGTHPPSGVDFPLYGEDEGEREGELLYPEREELHYWRKHPNLHGWMAKLYVSKGGKEPVHEFTGPVLLTLDDLKLLEAAVLLNNLPYTTGFFFGASNGSEAEGDLEFIRKAREAIGKGLFVYYDSSW